jgi:hypothetical protein
MYASVPNSLTNRVESPFDLLNIRDEERIYSNVNNRIMLEFAKPRDGAEVNEDCLIRRIVIGSCRLLDTKSEKPTNFEIIMPVFNLHITY